MRRMVNDGRLSREALEAAWTRRTGHVQAQCSRKDCDGTCVCCCLSICAICGGSEGSLLPKCPGRRLSYEEDQENYRHYCEESGPFAPTHNTGGDR